VGLTGQSRAATALAGAIGALLGASVLALRPQRVEVRGTSMLPTLLPGDRLLVVRPLHYEVGDLVVVPDPRGGQRVLVKRLAALPGMRAEAGGLVLQAGPDEVVVLGDNPGASTDSRAVGPLRSDDLRGRCVYRYHPPERVGQVGRPDPAEPMGAEPGAR
jgi:signal peptidase I